MAEAYNLFTVLPRVSQRKGFTDLKEKRIDVSFFHCESCNTKFQVSGKEDRRGDFQWIIIGGQETAAILQYRCTMRILQRQQFPPDKHKF